MQKPSLAENPETETAIDTSPRAMAARFGARARLNIQRGEDPREAARLAASYAFMVDPSLRVEPATSPLCDHLVRLATTLNRAFLGRRVH